MTNRNFWYGNRSVKKHPALIGDIGCDVLVIGAGISGVLVSYFLTKNGLNTVLVDATQKLTGNTAGTTAKITSLHGSNISRIAENFSSSIAVDYVNANEMAIDQYARIISDNNINCDFERLPSYLYSTVSQDCVQQEYAVSCKTNAYTTLCKKTSLPFDVKLALRFDNQAQFNPISFLSQLSEGIRIYENTRVTKVDETIAYCENARIKAKKIVFATHYPIINFPGYYFMRMHQSRSYVTVLKNADVLDGMYYCADKGGLSFRNYNNLLIVSGCSHRTGESIPHSNPYNYIEQEVKKLYPTASAVYKYSAQDCMTVDLLPYAGAYSPSKPNWYVMTGYSKWGMTNSMVCARLVSDLILGNKNSLRSIYDPHRFKSSALRPVLNEISHAVTGLSKTAFSIPFDTLSDIPYGTAKVIEYKGKRCAVYKSEQGKIYSVSPRCSHLGCRLAWNPIEKTWDCPCHGSRFSYTGELVDSPAQSRLNTK